MRTSQYVRDTANLIDNELSRGYEVNCIGCGKRLETWFKCPVCQMIYFCDCSYKSRCECLDTRTSVLDVIGSMTDLLGG